VLCTSSSFHHQVSNPEKIGFKPKELLTLVTEIVMNLACHEAFARAVVADGRSYDQKVAPSTGPEAITLQLLSPYEATHSQYTDTHTLSLARSLILTLSPLSLSLIPVSILTCSLTDTGQSLEPSEQPRPQRP
jgi:hypothetical protein